MNTYCKQNLIRVREIFDTDSLFSVEKISTIKIFIQFTTDIGP